MSASSFASVFAQQFSSFCLKQNWRVVSVLPDMAAPFSAQSTDDETEPFPLYNFILDEQHIGACEDWITQQHYSIVLRHIAADYTAYWLHDVVQSQIIQLRLIHHISLYGVPLLESNAIQQRASFKQLFYHADPIDQALIILLQYGFKEKKPYVLQHYAQYIQDILAQADTAITEKLVDLFGSDDALELERQIKRTGDASAIMAFSHKRFFYRAWMHMGGKVYLDMLHHYYQNLYNRLRNRRINIVFLGGSQPRKNELLGFLKQSLGSLHPFITFSTQRITPLDARLTRQLVMTIYLDKTSLSQQAAIQSSSENSLALPTEISLERSQGLLLQYIIARLDQYFSDNPI